MQKPDLRNARPSTLAVHSDSEVTGTRSVAPPIFATSTFAAEDQADFLRMASEPRHPEFYTRLGNPTHAHAETVLAALEGGESALLFGSGMAAITCAALSHLKAGDHIVAQKSHYGGTAAFIQGYLPKIGVETTQVDQTDVSAFEKAIRPNTRLMILESPSNPVMTITDLPSVSALARSKGIATMVDNTFCSPINQRPLSLGVDLVVHSATKFLGGHSDLIAGAVVGSKQRVEEIWKLSKTLGATLGPFESWLLLRGMRTLELRVHRHNQNALELARYLEKHPRVLKVNYPGLESHPQHALAKQQMSGFGGILSFDLKEGATAAHQLISKLKLPKLATSVGGVEALVAHIPSMWAGTLSEAELRAQGIGPGLIRYSTGIENIQDILADFEAALRS